MDNDRVPYIKSFSVKIAVPYGILDDDDTKRERAKQLAIDTFAGFTPMAQITPYEILADYADDNGDTAWFVIVFRKETQED